MKLLIFIIALSLSACTLKAQDMNVSEKQINTRIPVDSDNIYGMWERIGVSHAGTAYMAILSGCNVGNIYFLKDNIRLNQSQILAAINGGMIDGGKVMTWKKCNVSDGRFMQIPNSEHSYMENYVVYRDSSASRTDPKNDEISLMFFYPNWNGGPRPPIPPPPEHYRRVFDR